MKRYYYQQYVCFEGDKDWGFNDLFFKKKEDITNNLKKIFEENEYIESIQIMELNILPDKIEAVEVGVFIDREEVLGRKTYYL